MDHLRVTYSADFDLLSVTEDLIEFLIGVEFLRSR